MCAMSPKSMIPVTCRRSSRSRLSSVTSLWMIWPRSRGSTGTTRLSKRASTRASSSRRAGSSMAGASRASSGRCRWSHQIRRPAAVWKKPRSATPMRATTSPMRAIASASSSVAGALRPGNSGRSRTRWVVPPMSTLAIGEPSSVGRATGTGRAGSSSAMRSTAATSISITPRSSAAFETFRTQEPPSASVSRKFWSRSLTMAVAAASRPKCVRATSAAWSRLSAGGAASRTSVVIGADRTAWLRRGRRPPGAGKRWACDRIGNRHPRTGLLPPRNHGMWRRRRREQHGGTQPT